ncbi:hypothetical protein BC940DRAFT_290851 [Gongronella butleri]|nr:hypothetical protein BC940DRAFT_290851 [Gongronella butleri]
MAFFQAPRSFFFVLSHFSDFLSLSFWLLVMDQADGGGQKRPIDEGDMEASSFDALFGRKRTSYGRGLPKKPMGRPRKQVDLSSVQAAAPKRRPGRPPGTKGVNYRHNKRAKRHSPSLSPPLAPQARSEQPLAPNCANSNKNSGQSNTQSTSIQGPAAILGEKVGTKVTQALDLQQLLILDDCEDNGFGGFSDEEDSNFSRAIRRSKHQKYQKHRKQNTKE